jgi:hypothetical protein
MKYLQITNTNDMELNCEIIKYVETKQIVLGVIFTNEELAEWVAEVNEDFEVISLEIPYQEGEFFQDHYEVVEEKIIMTVRKNRTAMLLGVRLTDFEEYLLDHYA